MADSLPTAIELEIVTPDRGVVRETVEEVSTPGKEGYLGILPGHAPLLSELQTGELTYKKSGREYYLAINGGFAEVLPDRVIILTHTAARRLTSVRLPAASAQEMPPLTTRAPNPTATITPVRTGTGFSSRSYAS